MDDVACLVLPSPSPNLVFVTERLNEIEVVEFRADWQSRLDLLI